MEIASAVRRIRLRKIDIDISVGGSGRCRDGVIAWINRLQERGVIAFIGEVNYWTETRVVRDPIDQIASLLMPRRPAELVLPKPLMTTSFVSLQVLSACRVALLSPRAMLKSLLVLNSE